MLNALRRKLILLYTASTGFILTAVLIFVMIINNKQVMESKRTGFQNNYVTVNQSVQMESEIRHLWLAEMELKNQLIVQIEDNGHALMYEGAWPAPTDRRILIDKVKELAEKDNIDTQLRPISMNKLQSKIYQVKGNKNDRYLGEVFITPFGKGFRSVILLQYISDNKPLAHKRGILILSLDLMGVTAFFFLSRWIVGKSLKPVEEGRKHQTEFIAAASHELKSPLAVIRANASALLIEPERAVYYSAGIDKECRRMSGLVEDMLLLASIDTEHWKMKKEIIDMDFLLIEICDSFYSFCTEHDKDLKLELQEKLLPKIEGDELRIRQILAALIDNAAIYSKAGDIILIRAYTKKNQLWIEVEDHGPGINPKIKNELFERFYREDRARTDKNHYGLGLSIAKELTELHKGTISVRDTPGGGATFIICLPIDKSKSEDI